MNLLVRRRLMRASIALAFAASAAGMHRAVRAEIRLASRTDERVIDARQTQFGRLEVIEIDRTRYLSYGPGNRVFQSALNLDRPNELVAPYTRLMMLGFVYTHPSARIVQIGVGAGNMARYAIRTFPSVVVQAVDIDPHALELGARYFGLAPDPRLHLHVADGRGWLAASNEQYGVIMLDAYDDRSIPAHLMDAGFFRIVAARLAAGGVVIQNVFTPQVDAKSLMAAMGASFDQVDSYRVGKSVVLVGYQGAQRDPGELRAHARRLDSALRPVHSLEELLELRAGSLRGG